VLKLTGPPGLACEARELVMSKPNGLPLMALP
jgi:hypothetical protein